MKYNSISFCNHSSLSLPLQQGSLKEISTLAFLTSSSLNHTISCSLKPRRFNSDLFPLSPAPALPLPIQLAVIFGPFSSLLSLSPHPIKDWISILPKHLSLYPHCHCLSWFTGAAITKYHTVGWWNNRIYCLSVLEARSSKPRCGRVASFRGLRGRTCARPLSPWLVGDLFTFTWWSPCLFTSSSLCTCLGVRIFSFYKDTSHIGSGPL